MVAVLSTIIGTNVSVNDLLDLIREQVEPHTFVSKAVQENYNIYLVFRIELVKKGIDVVESHTIGPLIPEGIISLLGSGDRKMAMPREYDEKRFSLSREGRDQQGTVLETESEIELQPSTAAAPLQCSSHLGRAATVVVHRESPTQQLATSVVKQAHSRVETSQKNLFSTPNTLGLHQSFTLHQSNLVSMEQQRVPLIFPKSFLHTKSTQTSSFQEPSLVREANPNAP